MSRDITTAFRDEITGVSLRPIILITGEFDTETIRFWNGTEDLVYGGDTYTGAGHLLTLSSITETQSIEARGVVVGLSGLPSSLIAIALAEDYQGRTITIQFAVADDSGVIISDPFTFFRGKADVMEITEGGETATINISSENDLIALKRANVRRRTKEDQALIDPTDTFFDQVAANQSAELVWGQGQ